MSEQIGQRAIDQRQPIADFTGLAPSVAWSGEPDDTVAPATYLYDTASDAGGSDRTFCR